MRRCYDGFVHLQRLAICWCALLLIGISIAAAQDTDGTDQDSVERDYSSELPRVQPLDPQQAMNAFHVAHGFRIEQVACEPQVVDPVAMAFDESGRIYVVEMRDYSEDDALSLGRIRRLTDADGDGFYESSVVYAEGLAWPTALACYDGGLFVGAAPDIWYFKDTDGDGQADERRIVFTGFSKHNVQGLLNSFHWGYDNRLHGATSSSGADVKRPDAAPGTEPIALRGRDFSFDPRLLDMRPESGGAQHGMSFDAFGRKFVCSNSDHIQLVMFEDRYAARNPYAAGPPARVSIAADGPQADVFRTSPVEPWRLVRTRLRIKGVVPGIVEGGGRAAGYFTSATGVTIYLGDAWPQDNSGVAIVGDVGGNLIHRKLLEPQGIGLVAKRIDDKSEFVTSDDIWFRPVQFANGPDGTLYVLDMYREVIEHPASLHPIIKKHLDLTSGRDRGRIYRIVADQSPPRTAPIDLTQLSDEQLAQLLDHPNGWHRTTAARLIYERRPGELAGKLSTMVSSAARAEGRIGALYALESLESLTVELLQTALADSDPNVRIHALRLAESRLVNDAQLRHAAVALSEDQDRRVRYQLAFSLGYCDGAARDAALARIVLRDGQDPYTRFAVHSSLQTGAGAVLALVAAELDFAATEWGQDFIKQLAAQIGRQQRSDDVAAVLRVLASGTSDAIVETILTGLAAKAGSPLEQQISAVAGGRTSKVMQAMIADAQRVAAQADGEIAQRVRGVLLLQLSPFQTQQALFSELLAAEQPLEVQQATLQTLGTFADAEVADVILAAWPSMGPALRARGGELLATRPVWLARLLDGLAEQQIAPSELAPALRQSLMNHPDEALRQRSQTLLATTISPQRDQVLQQYQIALDIKGDADRGKEVFKKTCAGCHQLQGEGHPIGPNLAAMRNRGPEAILSNVIAPNAEVNPQYLTYAVVTKDGRTLTGMIADESATSVTLAKAENVRDTILRIDIEEMRSTGQSLMPEGMEKDLSPEALADVIAYLRAIE